jgi:hypothetical protein
MKQPQIRSYALSLFPFSLSVLATGSDMTCIASPHYHATSLFTVICLVCAQALRFFRCRLRPISQYSVQNRLHLCEVKTVDPGYGDGERSTSAVHHKTLVGPFFPNVRLLLTNYCAKGIRCSVLRKLVGSQVSPSPPKHWILPMIEFCPVHTCTRCKFTEETCMKKHKTSWAFSINDFHYSLPSMPARSNIGK